MKLIVPRIILGFSVTALVCGHWWIQKFKIQKVLTVPIYMSRFGVAFPDKKPVSITSHWMPILAQYIYIGNSLTDVLYGAYNPR
jgi:hypothetical protein